MRWCAVHLMFAILFFEGRATLADTEVHSLNFGGVNWIVRNAGVADAPAQPGNNFFSSRYGPNESVFVDTAGKLRLSIKKYDGIWHSAEISTKLRALNGTYKFRVTLPNDPPLDPRVAVAIFLYSDNQHEYDIEISQFLSQFDCTLIDCESCKVLCEGCQIQFVRQPFCEGNNWQRYSWPEALEESVHEISWRQGEFVRLSSSDLTVFPEHNVTYEFIDKSELEREYRLHLSMWLMDEGGIEHLNSPQKNYRQEVVFEILEIPVEMTTAYTDQTISHGNPSKQRSVKKFRGF